MISALTIEERLMIKEAIMNVVQERDCEPMGDFEECVDIALELHDYEAIEHNGKGVQEP